MNISQEDAIWLVTEYNSKRNYGKVSQWIDYHIRAMSIIKETPVGRPSCSCEFGAYARMANSMYEQNHSEIQATAYPPQIEVIDDKTGTDSIPKKRGRRASETNTEESKEL